jgi:hypothetical protein
MAMIEAFPWGFGANGAGSFAMTGILPRQARPVEVLAEPAAFD